GATCARSSAPREPRPRPEPRAATPEPPSAPRLPSRRRARGARRRRLDDAGAAGVGQPPGCRAAGRPRRGVGRGRRRRRGARGRGAGGGGGGGGGGAVAPARLASTVEETARALAAKGPLALRLGKEAVVRALDLPLADGIRLEHDLYVLLQTTADRRAGIE